VTDLARLVVKLSAQTAEYEKKLDQANARLGRFEKNTNSSLKRINRSFQTFNRALGAIGLGISFVAITRGLASAAQKAIQYGDEINKASAKTGVGAQAFSELAYAAKMSDIELSSLSTAFKKMQVSISQAGSGGKAAQETFAALGIEFASLRQLAPDRQFELIADRISQLTDPADRARAATELFGKAGADLLPMFEQGAAGIRKAREEAVRLGASLSEDQVKQLAAADDALKRLNASWEGLVRTLTVAVTPSLVTVFNAMQNALSTTPRVLTLAQAWEAVGKAFRKNGLGTSPFDLAREMQALDQAGQARRIAPGGHNRQPSQPTGQAPGFAAGSSEAARRTASAVREVKSATDEALESIQKMVDALEQQVATFDQGEAAALAYRITQGDLAKTFETAGAAAEPYKAQLLALTTQLVELEAQEKAAAQAARERAELEDQAASVIEGLKTEYDLASDAIDSYYILHDKGLLTYEQMEAAIRKVSLALADQVNVAEDTSEKLTVFWDQAMRNMQDIMADALFNSFEDGVDGMVLQWAQALKRMAAEALAAQIFGALTSGAKGLGGWLGGLVGVLPKFADGGYMKPNSWGIVGERGPELAFAGPRGATIEPIDGNGRNQRPIQITMNIQTPDADSFRRTETQIQARMSSALSRASARKN